MYRGKCRNVLGFPDEVFRYPEITFGTSLRGLHSPMSLEVQLAHPVYEHQLVLEHTKQVTIFRYQSSFSYSQRTRITRNQS